jgi:PLP dependent protein
MAERVDRVLERVSTAAARSGRPESDITVVAVSKTFPAAAITEGAAAGLTDFGENRAQELAEKRRNLGDAVNWHFVGRLQKNKVRSVTGTVRLIHSVDDERLAEAIARRAREMGVEQEVLVEVNLSGESSKSGVDPDDAVALAARVDGLDGAAVKGLMTIPAFPEEPESSRPAYRSLASLAAELAAAVPAAVELSMGMTRDFEVAIEEGATIVRIGEAIFGPRRSL